MKKIPQKISTMIRDRLWKQADEAGWTTLTLQQKTALYEEWSKAPGVGNLLEGYLDGRSVRVYIKDVIMKPYGRARIQDAASILTLLQIPFTDQYRAQFVKPHGRILSDGRTIAWGLAKDWKAIVLAVFERAFRAQGAKPYAVVLMNPDGKMRQPSEHKLVEEVAKRLDIAVVQWQDHSTSHDAEDSGGNVEPRLF
jgi:hypothetical protein